MEQTRTIPNPDREEAVTRSGEASTEGKRPFTEPRLTFVMPKLVKQGSVSEITAGFFGPFYP